jgi:hypothetical protein
MPNTVKRKVHKYSKSLTGWNKAVYDAEAKLAEAECRVIELTLALRHFKKMRDSGEVWPGDFPDANIKQLAAQS